jgi:hypothetical protein
VVLFFVSGILATLLVCVVMALAGARPRRTVAQDRGTFMIFSLIFSVWISGGFLLYHRLDQRRRPSNIIAEAADEVNKSKLKCLNQLVESLFDMTVQYAILGVPFFIFFAGYIIACDDCQREGCTWKNWGRWDIEEKCDAGRNV